MSRFPPIPPDSQTPKQQEVETKACQIFTRVPPHVHWRGASGVILGPYSPLPYTPDLVTPWFDLAFALNQQLGLTRIEKELAILAVLAEHNAPYVLYAHTEISLAAGLSGTQISDAMHGRVPDKLHKAESAVYMIALEMARSRGPIADNIFEPAVEALGREKVARVAHVVGGFSYVALLSNLAAETVPVMQDAEDTGA
ncbi:AhpD-like protein [Aspergillus nidulans var. acristatus]